MNDTNLVIPVFKCKRKNILRRFSITFSKIYKTFSKKKNTFQPQPQLSRRDSKHIHSHMTNGEKKGKTSEKIKFLYLIRPWNTQGNSGCHHDTISGHPLYGSLP